jgi:hypothetical protein
VVLVSCRQCFGKFSYRNELMGDIRRTLTPRELMLSRFVYPTGLIGGMKSTLSRILLGEKILIDDRGHDFKVSTRYESYSRLFRRIVSMRKPGLAAASAMVGMSHGLPGYFHIHLHLKVSR